MKFFMSTAAIAALAFVPATANAGGNACGANPCGPSYAEGTSRYGGNGPAGYYGGGYSYSNGYSYAGSSRYGGYGPAGGYGHGGYVGGGFIPGPVMSGPTYVHSGQYISGPVIPVTTYPAPVMRPMPILSQPRTVFTAPVPSGLTIAAPNMRLAGPPIRSRVVRRTYKVEHMPIARAERIVISGPASCGTPCGPVAVRCGTPSRPIETAPCPANTTPQSDGTCLQNPTVCDTQPSNPVWQKCPDGMSLTYGGRCEATPGPGIAYMPKAPIETAPCPAGTMPQSDGTCLEQTVAPMPIAVRTYSARRPITRPTAPKPIPVYTTSGMSRTQIADCPAGTSKQSDGTCLSSAVTSYTPSYSTSSVSTTYRAPAPTVTHHVPDTIIRAEDEYCYAGSSKRYDSLGNEIKSRHSQHCQRH